MVSQGYVYYYKTLPGYSTRTSWLLDKYPCKWSFGDTEETRTLHMALGLFQYTFSVGVRMLGFSSRKTYIDA